MESRTIHVDKPDESIKLLARVAFPCYRGRKFRVKLGQRIQFSGTQWQGGSRSQYVIVKLEGGNSAKVPSAPFLVGSPVHEGIQAICPGFVVVEHRIFCGRDMGLTIHARADDVQAMLPAPLADLSRDEKLVLHATCSLKSSYAGVSDYRFSEANRETGITRERWDTAKTSLIVAKLLNKRGAITAAGRNAAPDAFSFSAVE